MQTKVLSAENWYTTTPFQKYVFQYPGTKMISGFFLHDTTQIFAKLSIDKFNVPECTVVASYVYLGLLMQSTLVCTGLQQHVTTLCNLLGFFQSMGNGEIPCVLFNTLSSFSPTLSHVVIGTTWVVSFLMNPTQLP